MEGRFCFYFIILICLSLTFSPCYLIYVERSSYVGKLPYVSSLFVAVPLSSSSTVSGPASWSALSHYLANLASRLV